MRSRLADATRTARTAEECERIWQRAIEWYADYTLERVEKRAVNLVSGDREKRDMWVRSVQNVRQAGILDEIIAWGIINSLLLAYLGSCDDDADPVLREVGQRMDARLAANRPLDWFSDHESARYRMWSALCDELDQRGDELLLQGLREVGERTVALMLMVNPDACSEMVEGASLEMRADDEEAGEVRKRPAP